MPRSSEAAVQSTETFPACIDFCRIWTKGVVRWLQLWRDSLLRAVVVFSSASKVAPGRRKDKPGRFRLASQDDWSSARCMLQMMQAYWVFFWKIGPKNIRAVHEAFVDTARIIRYFVSIMLHISWILIFCYAGGKDSETWWYEFANWNWNRCSTRKSVEPAGLKHLNAFCAQFFHVFAVVSIFSLPHLSEHSPDCLWACWGA